MHKTQREWKISQLMFLIKEFQISVSKKNNNLLLSVYNYFPILTLDQTW